MKKKGSILVAAFFYMWGSSIGLAGSSSKSFNITATVPQASSVIIEVSKETPPGDSAVVASNALNFDLTFNGRYYSAGYYYRLKIKAQGGGELTTVVTYTEGQRPPGALKGLGDVCLATFYMGDYSTGGPGATLSVGGKLAGLNAMVIPAQIAGGFLIMHLGLENFALDPRDAPGLYDGILTISSTVS